MNKQKKTYGVFFNAISHQAVTKPNKQTPSTFSTSSPRAAHDFATRWIPPHHQSPSSYQKKTYFIFSGS